MKTFLMILLATLNVVASEISPVGHWTVAADDAKVEIYETGDSNAKILEGKIIWLKEPNDKAGKAKTDVENADAELRSQAIMGMIFLKNFRKDKDQWVDGTIYDAKSGKTYKATMKLEGDNTLELRGYVGIPLFGRTETWKRVKL